MTIEIRQLIIRASVQGQPDAGSRSIEAATSSNPPNSQNSQNSPNSQIMQFMSAHDPSSAEHDALVAACVREVLRKLERARGR